MIRYRQDEVRSGEVKLTGTGLAQELTSNAQAPDTLVADAKAHRLDPKDYRSLPSPEESNRRVSKMKQYVYRANKIRLLKEGVDLQHYLSDHPGACPICKPPCTATLEKWSNECGCKALDGCWVEPDGTCEHGKPSWLKAMGMI